MTTERSRGKAGEELSGGGTLGHWLRSHDWSQTPLGGIDTWSGDLRAAVHIVLAELDQAHPNVGEETSRLNAFRLTLANALRPLTDATEIQAIATRLLGEALGATRVLYIEVVAGGEEVIVHNNYTNGVAALSGRFRLADYHRNLSADHRAGRTQVVVNVPDHADYGETGKQRYREIEVAAYIDVPLIKDQQFVALLAVHQATPRQWTAAEVKLVEETAEQTWAAVERARAEAALRASEEKYRSLFESIDEAFFIAEVLLDRSGRPTDYRFLETNSMFGQHTGLHQAVGQTARQMVPDLEDFWVETYGSVALTGEPTRLENYVAMLHRWFDVYAYRTGLPEERKVAVVFKDISDRKRREANLVFLSDMAEALAQLGQVEDIMQTVGEDLAAFLNIQRCHFLCLGPADEEIRYLERWDAPGLPPLPETVPLSAPGGQPLVNLRRQRAAVVSHDPAGAAPQDCESLIAVPLQQRGEGTCGFAVVSTTPRQWRKDEVELVGEVANRLFLRLERARSEAALRESEEQLRLFITASSDVVYRMSADWGELRYLDGKDFLASIDHPSGTWLDQYIPKVDQPQLRVAIETAIATQQTFEAEHRVVQIDGTLGWAFFRAIPLLDGQGNIVEWLGAASDITQRKQAELNADFLATITQRLIEATDAKAILQTVGDHLNCYLQISCCAFIEINERADEAAIHQAWHLEEIPSLVGVYQLPEFVADGFLQRAKAGQPIVVQDVATDEHIADPQRFAALDIGAFINVPLIRDGEWKFALVVYHQQPYAWRSDQIDLMEELANRIWTMLERARAEQALRESEQRLQTAISIQSVGVLFFNLTGQITDANDAFLRMSGYSREELQALSDWRVLTPPEFWPVTTETAENLATQGVTASYEKQHIRRDGSRWWGLFSPTRLKGEGRQAECVEFIVDISDHKQAEALITADLDHTRLLRNLSARLISEDNIQVLYDEIMAAAIALTQADGGTVQILDPVTEDLVLLASYGFEPALANQFRRVQAGPDTPLGVALQRGTRTFVDFDAVLADSDDPLQVAIAAGFRSAQSTPLVCQSGRALGMVSTHWRRPHRPSEQELGFLDLLARQAADLIEQRQAEAERKQILAREQVVREQAETANRLKDEFLAVLSHELRSPLNPILGWTQLLQHGRLSPERQQEALATIERNAKLQTQLIDDLLDISRIMQGKLNLSIQPVNLKSVIAAALETVRLAAAAKNLQIQTQIDSTVTAIQGDAGRLQQVVWNLLSNAVKFTPTGRQITLTLTQTDAAAQIQVTDTGKGITPDFLPWVFDHFRQEDAATTRRFGGLGLGLAIARQIVEMHGGQIWVDSPGEDQGATFTVQLPLAPDLEPVLPPPPAAGLTQNLRGLHILVVDDETDSREIVAFVLETGGATVTRVASGREALAAIDQRQPDLIVSDIGMPEMDGYLLIQQIRSLELSKPIPAIALTAYAGEQDRQQAIAAGFQAHLAKPIEPSEIGRLIAQLCDLKDTPTFSKP